MTTIQFNTLPAAQRDAMVHLQARSGIDWKDFLEQAYIHFDDYVAIPNFHGMYVGIEKDGYTHS